LRELSFALFNDHSTYGSMPSIDLEAPDAPP
jgi:hypothetical protein